MNVLHFYRTYFPETQGGLEEAIRQISLATSKLGVNNRILTTAKINQRDVIERPEGKVIRVPLLTEPASCSISLHLFAEYRSQCIWADIIHIHHPWPFADIVHLVASPKKPVIVTYHSDIVRQKVIERLYAPLRSLFYKGVSRFVATSPNYLNSSPVLKAYLDKTEVIPLSLDEDSQTKPSVEAIDYVSKSFGNSFFLFIGVLRYYKGLHNLVEASKYCNIPIVIAGKGPELSALQNIAEKIDAKNIHFAGYVSDEIKQALLLNCYAVIFPSCERSEAFGVTLLEGQLSSKPLITCEIGTGTSFVNINNKTGIIVAPNSPKELSYAMTYLKDNPKIARGMGEAGRARVLSIFNSDKIGKSYFDLYSKLMK